MRALGTSCGKKSAGQNVSAIDSELLRGLLDEVVLSGEALSPRNKEGNKRFLFAASPLVRLEWLPKVPPPQPTATPSDPSGITPTTIENAALSPRRESGHFPPETMSLALVSLRQSEQRPRTPITHPGKPDNSRFEVGPEGFNGIDTSLKLKRARKTELELAGADTAPRMLLDAP